jgi:hypothetical protein
MRSVALFGERRIGKTSLLYLLRDIVNNSVNQYVNIMLDQELLNAIPQLNAKTGNAAAIYISLQELTGDSIKDFSRLVISIVKDAGINDTWIATDDSKPEAEKDNSRVISLFKSTNAKLAAQGMKLLVLFDEFEKVLDLKEGQQICGNLRAIIESCPNIGFVFAGAEYWHNSIKDKSTPLAHIVRMYYLISPAHYPLQQYLVSEPLRNYIEPPNHILEVTGVLTDWTGDKPCYVQAVCDEVVRCRLANKSLPPDWMSVVEARIFESMEATLDYVYSDSSIGDLPRLIIALLANHPSLSVKQISQKLGYSEKDVWNCVDDLVALDKLHKHGGEYRITGTIIEKWGKKYKKTPAVKSIWPNIFRWGAAISLLIFAVLIYLYANPSDQNYPFEVSNSKVVVRMPSSLEENESGNGSVSFTNTGQIPIEKASIRLSSGDIFYNNNGSNQIVFSAINSGETKYSEPKYSTSTSIKNANLHTKVFIAVEAEQPQSYEFEMEKRSVPIKKYWGLISLLFVTLSGFVTSKDLNKVIQSLGSLIQTKK